MSNRDVGPAEVRAGGLPVLDVREPHEWDAGHIDGAVHIPMGQVTDRIDEIPDGQPLAVVCRSGNRSAHVAAWLRRQGRDAVNLTGGMEAWAGAGYAFRSRDGGPGRVA